MEIKLIQWNSFFYIPAIRKTKIQWNSLTKFTTYVSRHFGNFIESVKPRKIIWIIKIIFTFSFPFRQLYSCYLYPSLNTHEYECKGRHSICLKMMSRFLRVSHPKQIIPKWCLTTSFVKREYELSEISRW